MSTLLDRWKVQYRTIYNTLYESPRIYYKDLAEILGINREYAQKRFKEALDQQYILGPEGRKCSYNNLKEYVYIIKCKNPDIEYLKYRKDMNVIYHAKLLGFSDLFFVTKKKFDIVGDIIVEGYRSDYHVSYAPDHTWETAMRNLEGSVESIDLENYLPKGIIQTHLDETIEWSPQDEILYRYLKYNMRKPLGPLMKEYKISREEIYEFLERLPETCTVFTHYYPETLSAYDPFLFMIETDYEDFIIDLFSQLPATSSFFKVSDKLFVYVNVLKQLIKIDKEEITANKLKIPLLLIDLMEKGIIKSYEYASVQHFTAKDL